MEHRKNSADHDESDRKHREAAGEGAYCRSHHRYDKGHLHRRHAAGRRTQLQGNAEEQRAGYDCVHRDMYVMNAAVRREVEQMMQEVQAENCSEEAREAIKGEAPQAPGTAPAIVLWVDYDRCIHIYRSVV
jgi:hypothetical protein